VAEKACGKIETGKKMTKPKAPQSHFLGKKGVLVGGEVHNRKKKVERRGIHQHQFMGQVWGEVGGKQKTKKGIH